MNGVEKSVEKPGFWRNFGKGAAKISGKALGFLSFLLSPLEAGPRFPHGDELYFIHSEERFRELYPYDGPRPFDNIVPDPTSLPEPAPISNEKDFDETAPKVFWVTYTKTKVMPDGSAKTYSGRSSGTYSGIAPTEADADRVVAVRERSHTILRSEGGWSPAKRDRFSQNYTAIRGGNKI
ncbi:MAG: hypothetical protein NVV59_09045 [Chitinophagaceae bacterium]|nr:hypothetical protein [Chitinophagaceae bacterium]